MRLIARKKDIPRKPDELKQEAIRQWTGSPAGANLGSREAPESPAFYRQVETSRYALYPWLRDYLREDRWKDRRVLEVGTGLGTDHLMLHRAGAIVTGVDLTPASVEHTRRRLEMAGAIPDVQEGDAERLPFSPAAFDGVYSFGVLHHTPDMSGSVNELARVLRPGGYALVAVYNRYSYFHAWRLLKYYLRRDWRRITRAEMRAAFEHGAGIPLVRLSSRAELLRMFRSAGFTQVTVRGRHLPLNRLPPHLAAKLARWLDPVARRIGWYWIVEATR